MGAEVDYEARYKLAEALAGGASVSAATKAAGYARKQYYRIKDDPDFMRMVEAAKARRSAAEADGSAVSSDDTRAAIQYLRGVVDDDDEEARDRITAAKALLAAGAVGKRAPRAATPETDKPSAVPLKVLSPKEAADQWRKRAQ